MNEKRERKSVTIGNRTPLEIDAERTLAELLSGRELHEPIKSGKKIIKTPDSETTIEYELGLDSRTGQQEIIEHVTTTKRECALCGRYTSQLRACDHCKMEICGACITSYHRGIDNISVCKSCFEGLSRK